MPNRSRKQRAEWSLDDDTALIIGFSYLTAVDDMALHLKRPVGDVVERLTTFGMFPAMRSDTIH